MRMKRHIFQNRLVTADLTRVQTKQNKQTSPTLTLLEPPLSFPSSLHSKNPEEVSTPIFPLQQVLNPSTHDHLIFAPNVKVHLIMCHIPSTLPLSPPESLPLVLLSRNTMC
jgi:hypothetical protein